MRNNKAILDEAARSVRRTFVGSVAGTLGMLAVVGAAGAYGMPERLTAHAFTLALTSLKITPKAEHASPAVDRVVRVAENVTQRDVMPMAEPVAPQKTPVVRTMPELPPEPAPAPLKSESPAAATSEMAAQSAPAIESASARVAEPSETTTASVSPAASALPIVETTPEPALADATPAGSAPAIAKSVDPAPARIASIAPQALPDKADEQPIVPAPLVFAPPKPEIIPPLAEMPKFAPVAPPAAEPAQPAVAPAPAKPAASPVPAQQAKPVEQANANEPAVVEWPKTVSILPPPKPPLTPAQRLDLHGKDYDKAEKCLAQAVYFEARDQAVRGQQAVAQVVLNRVFSPYYPKDVCSVVFQNAHRHLACQFTFACDGKPETIRERGAWARANRIAKQSLEAKVWLPEVDKATHYHASYVHPRWVREMKVMARYGIHTFYRPRNWGDGSDEPHWGTAANTAKPAVNVVAAKPHHPAPAPRKLAMRRI